MKKMKIAMTGLAAAACLLGASAMAQMQQVQTFSFPSQEGSKSPPSTLRISEQPGSQPAPQVRDSPESTAQYQRCRARVDREATNNTQLQAGVAACLQELEARRGQ
ncbi:hypothetical protein GG851_06205 [Bordetella petrii]|nr:hypothetical protein [Bordetella petrii]